MGRDQNRTSEILEAVALLVVDMQDAFLAAIAEHEALVRRCAFAIETAQTLGIRVFFTEQVPEKLGHTSSGLRKLAPDARVFSKNSFSCLAAQGLGEALRKSGIYHLLIVGIETPVCIYQTALHAHDSDFDVTLLSDCVGGRRTEDGRVVLQALAAANCHVLPAETVFYSMLGNSGHKHFAAYTNLVKAYADNGDGAVMREPPRAKPARAEAAAAATREERRPTEEETVVPFEQAEPEEGTSDEASDPIEPPADAVGNDEAPGADEGQAPAPAEGDRPRKRPRRRRGGTRRRKARERERDAGANPAAAEQEEGGNGEGDGDGVPRGASDDDRPESGN